MFDVRIEVAVKREQAAEAWVKKSNSVVGRIEAKIAEFRSGLAKKRAEKAQKKLAQATEKANRIRQAAQEEAERLRAKADALEERGGKRAEAVLEQSKDLVPQIEAAEQTANELHEEANERKGNANALGGLRNRIAETIR